jgi:hypothetical protein
MSFIVKEDRVPAKVRRLVEKINRRWPPQCISCRCLLHPELALISESGVRYCEKCFPKNTACAWRDCPATTKAPAADGWTHLSDWGLGIRDGIYCPAHAAAIEAEFGEGGTA